MLTINDFKLSKKNLDIIDKWKENFLNKKNVKPLVITGNKGYGKSSLANIIRLNENEDLPQIHGLSEKRSDLIGKFEKHLSELDLVSKYYIDKFSSDNTVYKIIYNSTPDKFLSEFRNLGFEVDTSYKIWKVR